MQKHYQADTLDRLRFELLHMLLAGLASYRDIIAEYFIINSSLRAQY